jgi:hypothetical protein
VPLKEFECPKGHTFVELVALDTKSVVCNACVAETPNDGRKRLTPYADLILSPTRTTFQHADRKLKL